MTGKVPPSPPTRGEFRKGLTARDVCQAGTELCVYLGPVILTKFSKIAMLHVVLDWHTIYETVLQKVFLFILFLVLVQKNLKMVLLRGENFFPLHRSIGYHKAKNWMLILKMST
jgi:hypothetical protein